MLESHTMVLSVDSALESMPERRLFPEGWGLAVVAGVLTGCGCELAVCDTVIVLDVFAAGLQTPQGVYSDEYSKNI